MTNFIKYDLRPKGVFKQPNQLQQYTGAGVTYAGNSHLNAPIQQNMKQANMTMELHQQLMTTAGAIGAWNYQSILLTDIIPELLNIEIWDLRVADLELTLRLTSSEICQYRIIGDTGVAQNNIKNAAIQHTMEDVLIY